MKYACAIAIIILTGKITMSLDKDSVFWSSFYTGLASPVELFSEPVYYYPYLNNLDVAQNFATFK